MTNIIDLTKRVRDFRDTYRGIDELGACDLLDEAAHVLHTLGADLYKADGQRDALATKLDSANGCISDWVTFGAEVTEALGLKVMSPKDILREIERLRGLRPEIPERPPHNNDASHQHPALPRYGLRWNGPGEPVSVPMPDGYWTPFHLALEGIEQARGGTVAQLGAALDYITNGERLHANTAHLVLRFARALAEKLARAEVKYGYSDGWLSPDWMDECRAQLVEHVAKGDPRDVAAYCAFLWHHGQSTTAQHEPVALTSELPRAWGVSRDLGSPGQRSVLVSFERTLTDDELRALHDMLCGQVVTG